ncbi:hypothetical protein KIW84_052500 [Lathyrus oleraceus]|uniref:Uncharacterized protein n=1 Tax=Pisum sativum TaxID=3888 RepID=A0A9D5AEZ5_PEA|nr:hypothetical protein KIW84_052500 [Pisum sativum]
MMLNPGGEKFQVTQFDRMDNFGLWQRMVKDLLTQQGLQKALCDEKPADITTIDWNDMEDKAASLIRLCVSDNVINHWFKEQGVPLVVGYVDSDYAGDLDDMRSTMGYVFTLAGDIYAGNYQFNP